MRAAHNVDDKWRTRLAADLSHILSMPAEVLKKKLESTKSAVRLKNNISPWAKARLEELNVKGLRTQYKSQRFYPLREQLAHIVGYTDHLGVGRSGVEHARHALLSPDDGELRVLRTSTGKPLNEFYYRRACNFSLMTRFAGRCATTPPPPPLRW